MNDVFQVLSEEELMESWPKNPQPILSIWCITYNQDKYIEDTIKGFLSQKTTFPFHIYIHDDCSSDKTLEIIQKYAKQYPHVLTVMEESENQHSKGVEILQTILYPRTKTKYIAICEGDDYWNDPLKLQIQVAYMEEHAECSLTIHGHYKKDPHGHCSAYNLQKERDISLIEIIDSTVSIATNTYVFRRDKLDYMNPIFAGAPVGDIPMRVILAMNGYVHYIPRIMSVYRVNAKNSWTSRMKKDKKKAAEVSLRMAQMFERIDEQTEGKYHNLIEKKCRGYVLDNLVFSQNHLSRKTYQEISREYKDEIIARGIKFWVILQLKRFWLY